jgi:hypothetical protein
MYRIDIFQLTKSYLNLNASKNLPLFSFFATFSRVAQTFRLCRVAFCTTNRRCRISRHLKGLGHETEFTLKVKNQLRFLFRPYPVFVKIFEFSQVTQSL